MLDFLFKPKDNISISPETSPTICPLPFMSFYGTASGAVVACCESQETKMGESDSPILNTWNGEAYKQLRKDLLMGKKPELCKKCWRNESSGLKSNRQQALEDYESKLLNQDTVFASADGSCSSFPSFVELKCSNVCNLKCRMCHPESSHRIVEDREIIDLYRKGLPWSPTPLRPTFLFEQIKNLKHHELSRIRVLQYSGGEPLISREQFELTSALADKYGENIQLRYSTNLNSLTFEKYNALELWKKFRHIHVKISADGIDDVYDYIRSGGSFEILKKNLDALLSSNLEHLDIAIGFTTQVYNVFQLPEFLDFFSQYVSVDRITTHLLYTPKLLCVDNLPHELANRVIQKLKASRWDFSDKIRFLEQNTLSENNSKNWQDLLSYTGAFEKKYNQTTNGYLHLMNKYLSAY